MVTKVAKWISIPVLLLASMVSRSATGYQLLVDLLICMGATCIVTFRTLLAAFRMQPLAAA
jgi:hypothetical protein